MTDDASLPDPPPVAPTADAPHEAAAVPAELSLAGGETTAASPPPPKPPTWTPKTGYLPRAFGFSHESLFIEATLYRDPRDQRAINADGRFLTDSPTDDGSQEWVLFDTLDELVAKARWDAGQMGRFTARITKLLESR